MRLVGCSSRQLSDFTGLSLLERLFSQEGVIQFSPPRPRVVAELLHFPGFAWVDSAKLRASHLAYVAVPFGYKTPVLGKAKLG